jgi:Leucine-rich repeat (LRR) protein
MLHNMLELRMINLEGNQFQGLLPRSFANCTRLEAIDVSNNQFNDTFPSGLGNLPNLKLLLLRSNKFYGQILESLKPITRSPTCKSLISPTIVLQEIFH